MAKNIILLSDGTGNSAAKAYRTNVWRLYQALDLSSDDQVAFYDDGVGSQQFFLLKALGGALGLGLKGNVLQLYEFLCRSYEEGDRIYVFGFSRGAFTVRTLVGLIHRCGLVRDFKSESDLHEKAKENFKTFRRSFRRGLLIQVDRMRGGRAESKMAESKGPEIAFVGVWDTVDAYGLPIDELALVWDYFIRPIRFPDQRLARSVQKARHALAIDDERHTFHPVLWDESGEKDPQRIQQVWFAGVHSNIGGGYPKDGLAFVTLDWMVSEVEGKGPDGLRFIPYERKRIRERADLHGTLYDSRRGLAAYYRYKPRDIEALCNDVINDVKIARPKIHDSVLRRIEDNVLPYSPVGIPETYDLVSTVRREDGPATRAEFEDKNSAEARARAMNGAWNFVFLRRWLYFALLGSTLLLFASRFFLDWSANAPCQGKLCFVDPIFGVAGKFLPDLAAGWNEALRQNPDWLFGFVLLFCVLFFFKKRWFRLTQERSSQAWAAVKADEAERSKVLSILAEASTIRFKSLLPQKYQRAFNLVVAFVSLLLFAGALLLFVNRAIFEIRASVGSICQESESAELLQAGMDSLEFSAAEPCLATGYTLKKGERYRFEVALPDGGAGWFDGGIPTDPDGFEGNLSRPHMILATPARRSWSEPWFKLMGRIGGDGKDRFPIGIGPTEIEAGSDGELFLFVNDAVCGFCFGQSWALPYSWPRGKNEGDADVTITPVSDSP